MPKFTTSISAPSSGLPHSVEDYLSSSVSEGGRNHALHKACNQLRDVDCPIDDAKSILEPKALADGLPAHEINQTIESSYRASRREPPSGSGGNYKANKRKSNFKVKSKSQHGTSANPIARATAVTLPEPEVDGFKAILLKAFEEGEGVCVGATSERDDGSRAPEVGVTNTREFWLDKLSKKGSIEKIFSTKEGLFLRVNPMKIASGTRNGNDDVTSFRHVLVEFDKDKDGETIPKEKQFGALLASNLPITAILDSGNKSVHAWVRVDASDKEQYNERVDEVYALFDQNDLDTQNRNPSRYSRCPDGKRTVEGEVRYQRLLKTSLGADSWEDWERQNSVRSIGEPWRPLDSFDDYPIEDDPNTVIGNRWLCKGGSLVFVSQSGVGKSSMQMQLKVGWALSREDMTFGIKPIKPLKQLTLQAENDQGDVAEAWRDITNAYSLDMDEKRQVNENCLWHRITTLVGQEFLNAVEALVQLHKPDICWIDPLLNYIGDDISKTEVVSEFCVEGLNAIALRTGVIFAIIHHTGKPKDSKTKEGMTASDLAYMGLGSSSLTNWAREVMVLNRVKTPSVSDPATFTLTATKRRTRAGMQTMVSGEEPVKTAEIYVRHAVDRIAWEQCEEPNLNKESEGATATFSIGGKRKSSLSVEQQIAIIELYLKKDGDLSAEDKKTLAHWCNKSDKTILRYITSMEEQAAREGSSEGEWAEHCLEELKYER